MVLTNRNYTMHDTHVKGAQTIAQVAKECGVERLIHVSALNAGQRSTGAIVSEGSEWLKTKVGLHIHKMMQIFVKYV